MSAIRRSFKRKIGKFAGGMSLVLLSAMFVVFFLSMPDFLMSTAGRAFVGVWALVAVTSFFAYGTGMKTKKERQYVSAWGTRAKKMDVPRKYARQTHCMDYRVSDANTSSKLFSR